MLIVADGAAPAFLIAPADGTGAPTRVVLETSSSFDVRPAWQPIR